MASEITDQDITIAIGAIGLYLAWRNSHNMHKLLEDFAAQIPVPAI